MNRDLTGMSYIQKIACVKEDINTGVPLDLIASRYELSEDTVNRIETGETYENLKPLVEANQLKKKQVKESRQLLDHIEGSKTETISVFNRPYTAQPCEYVHQLQNLYFALTGTELELSQKHLNSKPTAPEEQ